VPSDKKEIRQALERVAKANGTDVYTMVRKMMLKSLKDLEPTATPPKTPPPAK